MKNPSMEENEPDFQGENEPDFPGEIEDFESSSDEESMEPADVIKRLLNAAQKVATMDEGDLTKELLKALQKYDDQHPVPGTPEHIEIGNHLADNGAVELMKVHFDRYAKKLKETNYMLEEQEWVDFKLLLKACVNYSDLIVAMSQSIARCGILPILVEFLKGCKSAFRENSEIHREIVEHSLSILYNCSLSSINKKYYKRMKAGGLIKWYANMGESTPDKISACAMLLIAHTVEVEEIIINDDIFTRMIETMKAAMEAMNLRSMGFSAKELALGLTKLANNSDSSSRSIGKSGAILTLMKMATEGEVGEQTTAMNCIWALSLNEDNKKIIKELREESVIEKLEELTKYSELGKAADNVIMELREAEAEQNKLGENSGSSHVLLLCSADDQKVAMKIKQGLESERYRVWADVDCKGGSTLQAMADAVEQSAVVLICMSQKYKDSLNCRSKTVYVKERNKPMIILNMKNDVLQNGWLEPFSQNWIPCYKFIEENTFGELLSQITKQIGDKGKIKENEEVEPLAKRIKLDKETTSQISTQSMTLDDIREWAKEHQQHPSHYRNVNGEALIFLGSMGSGTPHKRTT